MTPHNRALLSDLLDHASNRCTDEVRGLLAEMADDLATLRQSIVGFGRALEENRIMKECEAEWAELLKKARDEAHEDAMKTPTIADYDRAKAAWKKSNPGIAWSNEKFWIDGYMKAQQTKDAKNTKALETLEKCRIKSASSPDGTVWWADCHDGAMMILHIEIASTGKRPEGNHEARELSNKIIRDPNRVDNPIR